MELKCFSPIVLRARILALASLLCAGLTIANSAHAQTAPSPASSLGAKLKQQVRQLVFDAHGPTTARLEVVIGKLDSRLRLGPCERVEPFVPGGAQLWGKTRIGLRCLQGPTQWNVYLPLTVKVYGQGLTATRVLPAGSVLAAADLRQAEVDIAEEPGVAVIDYAAAIGRTLAKPFGPGHCLRESYLRPRSFFASGERVRIQAAGPGFEVATEGIALGPGLEGRPTRVRTEGGRVVKGIPIAVRRLQLNL